MHPFISLIIPARNEQALLPRLLDSVDRALRRTAPGEIEVIVADNVSTDATAEIARRRGFRVVTVEKRVIAAVRNAGARSARGEILAFVDADSRVDPGTFDAIREAIASGRAVAGATGVRMERLSPGIAVTFAVLVPLVWLTGMDTGVVFCRRSDFEAIGGYDERLRVAEDVSLLWRLRRLGRARGQRLVRLRRVKALGSTRKFDRYGDWHYLAGLARTLFGLLFSRQSVDRFVQRYWYDDRG
jgi:glycosyltransferase involved in cell wall biosynthesis